MGKTFMHHDRLIIPHFTSNAHFIHSRQNKGEPWRLCASSLKPHCRVTQCQQKTQSALLLQVIHTPRIKKYLGNFGIILQFLQLSFIVLNELLQHRVVVMHGVLTLRQIQASLELLHIQEDVF